MRFYRILMVTLVLALLAVLPASGAVAQRYRKAESDTSITSVTATQLVETGESVTVEAVIENSGRQSVSVDVSLEVTPDGPDQSETVSIGSESSQTVSFEWTAESAGDVTSTVTINSDDDSDTGNNSGSAETTVSAADGATQGTTLTVASLEVRQVGDPSTVQLEAVVEIVEPSAGSDSRYRRGNQPEPVEGATVEVVFTGPDGVETAATGTTDADGRTTIAVTITDLPDGESPWTYDVEVTEVTKGDAIYEPGPASSTTIQVRYEPSQDVFTVQAFSVSQVDDPDPIQLTAEVTVVEQQESGSQPAAGVLVEATFTGPRGVETTADGTTDANGQVTITATITDHPHGLAPWMYEAEVTGVGGDTLVNPAASQELLVRAQAEFIYAVDQIEGIYKMDRAGNVLASYEPGGGAVYHYAATDLDGNVYVVNASDVTVEIFDANLNLIGSFPIVDGTVGVWGITIDDEENIYVTDTFGNRVLLFNPDGTPRAGQWPSDLLPVDPYGVAVDRDGNVYVPDFSNSLVRVFDQSGTLLDTINIPQFEGPNDVALDGDGNLYVADYGAGTVYVFDQAGNYVREFGSGVLQCPEQVAIDAWDDTVYIVDTCTTQVEIFDADGNYQGSINYTDSDSDNIGVTLGY